MVNTRPIRRGQLISPFGVGALVDFRGDESLMTAGLDEWPFANEECPQEWFVQEERLQKRLNVAHFRLPPEYREPGKESNTQTNTFHLCDFHAGNTARYEGQWSGYRFSAYGSDAHVGQVSIATQYMLDGVLGLFRVDS